MVLGQTIELPTWSLLLEIDPNKPGLKPLILGRFDPENSDAHLDIDLSVQHVGRDSGVSRRHLQIMPRKREFIVDPEAKNITFYNGRPIETGIPYRLNSEGWFAIGKVHLLVRLRPLNENHRFSLTKIDYSDRLQSMPSREISASFINRPYILPIDELVIELANHTLTLLHLDALYTSLFSYVLTFDPNAGWEAVVAPNERQHVISQLDKEISNLPEKYRDSFYNNISYLQQVAASGAYEEAEKQINHIQDCITDLLADGREFPLELV